MLAGRPLQPDPPRLDALRHEHVLSPRVVGQPSADVLLALGLDDLERIVAVAFADGAAENDETLLDETIHELGVRAPTVLLAAQPRGIP